MLLSLLGLVLASCTLLETPEPLPLYTLQSGPFERANTLKESLAIDTPLCEARKNTKRIALTPSPYQRDYFADGSWPDRLPNVFQTVLLDGLTQRWGGIKVNPMRTGLQTKYVLQSEIQDFSIHDCDGAETEAHIKVLFKVVNLRDRKVVASQSFEEKVPLHSLTMETIIVSFNQGTHSLLERTISWMEKDVF